MENELCNRASKIISEAALDILNVSNYGYYLWLFRKNGDMIGIVHGGQGKPFELKIVNVGGEQVVNKQFNHWNEFEYYLRHEMRSEILAMAI